MNLANGMNVVSVKTRKMTCTEGNDGPKRCLETLDKIQISLNYIT